MSIEVANESQHPIDAAGYQRLATFVMRALHVHPDADLSLIFVEPDAIERLNEQWMGEPGPTDVLSFPMDELRPGRPDAQTPAGLLGDVVVCPSVARVQAAAAGHSVEAEMQMLVTHGMLHLLGFDHGTPEEEAEMFALQRKLLVDFSKAQAEW